MIAPAAASCNALLANGQLYACTKVNRGGVFNMLHALGTIIRGLR
jgi:hypothetical protein